MRLIHAIAVVAALAGLPVVPAAADGFRKVISRTEFVGIVSNRLLSRFGISLAVSSEGGITGRAFGASVRGTWHWSDGHFCRELEIGERKLALNCQAVLVRGNTIRFIADRGLGGTADLMLR